MPLGSLPNIRFDVPLTLERIGSQSISSLLRPPSGVCHRMTTQAAAPWLQNLANKLQSNITYTNAYLEELPPKVCIEEGAQRPEGIINYIYFQAPLGAERIVSAAFFPLDLGFSVTEMDMDIDRVMICGRYHQQQVHILIQYDCSLSWGLTEVEQILKRVYQKSHIDHHALQEMLTHPELAKLSTTRLSKLCGLSAKTISKYRAQLGLIPEKVLGADGKWHPVMTRTLQQRLRTLQQRLIEKESETLEEGVTLKEGGQLTARCELQTWKRK
jgi:hypothetical protein